MKAMCRHGGLHLCQFIEERVWSGRESRRSEW